MTVSATVKTATDGSGKVWVHLAGTIAEVAQELADESVSAGNVVYYSDDGTDAKALYCKTK